MDRFGIEPGVRAAQRARARLRPDRDAAGRADGRDRPVRDHPDRARRPRRLSARLRRSGGRGGGAGAGALRDPVAAGRPGGPGGAVADRPAGRRPRATSCPRRPRARRHGAHARRRACATRSRPTIAARGRGDRRGPRRHRRSRLRLRLSGDPQRSRRDRLRGRGGRRGGRRGRGSTATGAPRWAPRTSPTCSRRGPGPTCSSAPGRARGCIIRPSTTTTRRARSARPISCGWSSGAAARAQAERCGRAQRRVSRSRAPVPDQRADRGADQRRDPEQPQLPHRAGLGEEHHRGRAGRVDRGVGHRDRDRGGSASARGRSRCGAKPGRARRAGSRRGSRSGRTPSARPRSRAPRPCCSRPASSRRSRSTRSRPASSPAGPRR